MKTRTWIVYGADGHRQAASFGESVRWVWTKGNNIRIFECLNYDITGSHDFSIVHITRNTAEECEEEFWGQISDGYFENDRVGRIVEITEGIVSHDN